VATPIITGKLMPVIFPGLTYELYADREVIRDDTQGLLIEGNCGATPITSSDGVVIAPHCGRLVKHTKGARGFASYDPWELLEARFAPIETAALLGLRVPGGEKADTSHGSHTTGGGRRYYQAVSPLMVRELGNTAAVDALTNWTAEQLNRPLWHAPWDFKCDSASCKLKSGWAWDQTSPKPPDGTGWGGWDPAHLETAPLFGLGLIGDSLGPAMVWLLMRWVQRALPVTKTHWRNQPRATGWRLKSLIHLEILGGSGCDPALLAYFGISKPKADARAAADWLIANWPALGAGNVDQRCMPAIKGIDADALGLRPGSEIVGTYLFQELCFLWCCIYAAESGFLGLPRGKLLIDLARKHWNQLRDRAVGDGGMSAGLSTRTDWSAAIGGAQAVADVCTKIDARPGNNGRTYSVDSAGGIRSHFRVDDCEMALAVAAYFDGVGAQATKWLEAAVRKNGKMIGQAKFVDEGARYLLPYAAILDGTFVPSL
jgi:hypothetical protein